MRIIREQPVNFPAIHDFVREAFEGEPHAEGDEQEFVNRQRASASYIPELALIAEEDGQMVGYIMLVRIAVARREPSVSLLLLAVVSVLRSRRGQRIGAQLVEYSLRQGALLGFHGVVVLGDPAYYGRFGFVPSVNFGIHNSNNIEEEFVMAKELLPSGLLDAAGTLSLPS